MKGVRKAVAAAGYAAAAALGAALLDGGLTVPELLASLGVGLVTGAGTYAAPANLTRPGQQPEQRP
jgi:hypothetical protein